MNKKIFFASGGTGGHIFPAIGLMEYLKNKGHLITIGTDLRGIKYLNNSLKVNSYTVNTGIPSKSISLKNFIAYFKILISIFRSILILKKEKPNLIIGFGGYVSFPYCVAGIILRIPFFLYENNLILGRANKHLLPFSNKLLTSNDIMGNYPKKYKHKISCIGHILREDFLKKTQKVNTKKNNKFTILIMGGSQGAEIFGKVIPDTLKNINSLGHKIKIYQQCTKNQKDLLINFYEINNIESEVFYFTDNIPELMMESDLAISRSGASTMAEFVNTLTPFITIPYPYAADNHQYFNAMFYKKNGCCLMLEQSEFSNKNLFELIVKIIKDKNILESIRENMKTMQSSKTFSEVEKNIKELL